MKFYNEISLVKLLSRNMKFQGLHFTEYADEGGVQKARCNLCPSGPEKKPWDTVANATRIAKHLKDRHSLKGKPEVTEFIRSSSER